MSNEIDPRTTNSPDNVQESTKQAQSQNELSDDELAKVAGGGIKVPQQPVDNFVTIRKAGGQ